MLIMVKRSSCEKNNVRARFIEPAAVASVTIKKKKNTKRTAKWATDGEVVTVSITARGTSYIIIMYARGYLSECSIVTLGCY